MLLQQKDDTVDNLWKLVLEDVWTLSRVSPNDAGQTVNGALQLETPSKQDQVGEPHLQEIHCQTQGLQRCERHTGTVDETHSKRLKEHGSKRSV